jgi:hypothetical protein
MAPVDETASPSANYSTHQKVGNGGNARANVPLTLMEFLLLLLIGQLVHDDRLILQGGQKML